MEIGGLDGSAQRALFARSRGVRIAEIAGAHQRSVARAAYDIEDTRAKGARRHEADNYRRGNGETSVSKHPFTTL
jgi:hypothetical protein